MSTQSTADVTITYSESVAAITPSKTFTQYGVEPEVSYTFSLPSHDVVVYGRITFSESAPSTNEALTRYFPVGSQVADLTGLLLSDTRDTLLVSLRLTILTTMSLKYYQQLQSIRCPSRHILAANSHSFPIFIHA